MAGFDFASVTAASLKADLDATLGEVEALVGAIPGAPATFEHVFGALDEAWARTLEADGRTSNLMYVHPDESVRDAAQVALSRLEAWRNGLVFREDLERAVVHYATTPEAAGLTGEGRRLLEVWLRDFRRAGQGLPAGEREAIATLRRRLTELEATFGRNVVDHEDWIEVDRAGLAGLPDDFIDRLTPGSQPGTRRVSLAYAELQAFVALADDRDLREALLRKHWSRAPQNSGLPAEILGLRREIAQRLGYANHAEYVAEVRMADTVPRIRDFLDEYAAGVQPRRDDELEILGDLLEEDGHGRAVAPWDWRYYAERRRRRYFDVDQSLVAEHLPLNRVMDGMFEIIGTVFGVRFRALEGSRAWHPSVSAVAVDDLATERELGIIYLDLLPRPGKEPYAFVATIAPGRRLLDGARSKPVCLLLMNLNAPTKTRPTLLRHEEMVTLFHEFGHALHHVLVEAEFARFGIDGVERDFVEGPSQLFENWAWSPSVLGSIARHYRSGEVLAPEIIAKLVAARKVVAGLDRAMQHFNATVDQSLHLLLEPPDFPAVHRKAWSVTGLKPYMDGSTFETSFSHVFGGYGYDAGYYGYLWAEVIGFDIWSRFAAAGERSTEVGDDLRRIVFGPSGARPAAEAVREFLGRDPTIDSWRAWLAEDTAEGTSIA